LGVAWWWPGQVGRKLPVLATLGMPGKLIFPLARSADGSALVTGESGGGIAFWDVATWRVRAELALAARPLSLVF
jgi:hypothetical protein